MILETSVWCIEKDGNELLGIKPSGDLWLRYAVDLREIVSVKQVGPNHEFLDPRRDCAIQFRYGETVTVKTSYEEVFRLWKEANKI